jgi:hypothetical protein
VAGCAFFSSFLAPVANAHLTYPGFHIKQARSAIYCEVGPKRPKSGATRKGLLTGKKIIENCCAASSTGRCSPGLDFFDKAILMKAAWFRTLVPALLLAGMTSGSTSEKATPVNSPNVLAGVKNLTRVKIYESNNVTLRPGSVYDTASYYEVLAGLPEPGFNYEFLDAGLGAAEPVYPMFEKGTEASYAQTIRAVLTNSRHIDNFATVETPEGCRVDSAYLSRDTSDYPEFKQQKDQGYEIFLLRLDYYTRLRPGVQCGRHRTNDPDPDFDAMRFIKQHQDAMRLSEFPQKELARFEAKSGFLHQVRQEVFANWPRFDLNGLTSNNSLWYYPQGHSPDYGISEPRPQLGLSYFKLPRHMLIEATPETDAAFPLNSLLRGDEFQKVLNFLSGRPTPDFDPDKEPGHDTFRLSDVTEANDYTSGLSIESIKDVVGDVSDPSHFRLVAISPKPYEQQTDIGWSGSRVVPQLRFVYQLMDPRHPDRAFEQLYLHLKFDVVDRLADARTQRAQHLQFLSRLDELTHARESGAENDQDLLRRFITDYTSARPVEQLAFSSSLSGIWVFGTLSRDENQARELLPVRIVRDGVDVGYYSSIYDNDIFRAEQQSATGVRKEQLKHLLDDLTVSFYRDPKRQNANAINFNRVTCAQCHQTSARDGVHIAFNDGLNKDITSRVEVSEYFFHDADEQLKLGMKYWAEEAH